MLTQEEYKALDLLVLRHFADKQKPLSFLDLADHPPKGMTGRQAEICAQRLTEQGKLELNNELRFELVKTR